MAHIAKYKATSVGHMLAHYRRDASSLERDNIDPKRVENDMVVGHYTNKDGRLVVGRVARFPAAFCASFTRSMRRSTVPQFGSPSRGTTRPTTSLPSLFV